MNYPKRLIEVDLPIKRISAHAVREKSIRQGHISTMHIWWARRPLAACRAVICASLWPDPCDPLCPKSFIDDAKIELLKWAENDHLNLLSKESVAHFMKVNHDKSLINNESLLRTLLFDFIADFSNWDNSDNSLFIATAQYLTSSAHIALGGEKGTIPLIVDPFAGGGAIPIEALRVGAEAFASDLNPIPVLLNKIQLEYIPKYGKTLADEIVQIGDKVNKIATEELNKYYPEHNGKKPLGYIWARTIVCEGPNCGGIVPLIRKLWLSKKDNKNIALSYVLNKPDKKIGFKIVSNIREADLEEGTIKRGSVICPLCDFTTEVKKVRKQLEIRAGGTTSAMLLAIRMQDRNFVLPTEIDFNALDLCEAQYNSLLEEKMNGFEIIPNEPTPLNTGHRAVGSPYIYGMRSWSDLYTNRQLVSICQIIKTIKSLESNYIDSEDKDFYKAVFTCLYFSLSRLTDFTSSLCRLNFTGGRGVANTFGRQALQMVWDFMESNPINPIAANWESSYNTMADTIAHESHIGSSGNSMLSDATQQQLPDDSCEAFITDPPYYDSVPYADLADFFYVWIKRGLKNLHPDIILGDLTPKKEQAIVLNPNSNEQKIGYEDKMSKAMHEGVRILKPNGIGVVVFAHKSTSGWESQLQSMLNAGWIITGSWPIDTERAGRVNSQDTASLASSIHLICRPRENPDGSIMVDNIGDWRDILKELPKRIHEWMPRLANEGVVGADAIFACLGPALEIYSRYSKVVMPGSEKEVFLKEYLEKVWEAVSKEALKVVFEGVDTSGFEEDARISAMWLWTITGGANNNLEYTAEDDVSDEDDDENSLKTKNKGYVLEYDTARKIAQGLGGDLTEMYTLIEVKKNKARLLPVIERTIYLFGTDKLIHQPTKKTKKIQASLFETMVEEGESKYEMPELKIENTGSTVLDRLHQAMILFATSRTDALKRFLLEDGVGKDERFWKLAQAFTALYPKDTDERRWVEAVQTYKKGLGF